MSTRAFIGMALLIAALVVAGSPTLLHAVDRTATRVLDGSAKRPKEQSKPHSLLSLDGTSVFDDDLDTSDSALDDAQELVIGNEIYDDEGPTGESRFLEVERVDGRLAAGAERLPTVQKPTPTDTAEADGDATADANADADADAADADADATADARAGAAASAAASSDDDATAAGYPGAG